jgi:heme oxygenase
MTGVTLKELTKTNHTKAEKQLFVKKMLKKQLTPEQYYVYLSNQASMYWFLESYANDHDIFDGIEEMKRSKHILQDLKDMEQEYGFRHPIHTKTTERYLSYIRQHAEQKDILLAHVYVRHLGDLSGGQIIKRFVPVAYTKHYEFDGNPEEIKERFKQRLSNNLAPEANKCFEFMIDFFQDLEVQFGF